jgi:hypothetical protein
MCPQILGREYYQRPETEKLLVTLPIFVHVGASALKRVLPFLPGARRAPAGSPEAKLASLQPRPLRAVLAWSGYLSLLALLPVHYPTHRLFPALESAGAFGPARLDFEFVKAGLHAWPARSAALYAALVGATLVHAADGAWVLLAARGWTPGRRVAWRVAGALAAVPVLAGTWVLWNEPSFAFEGLLADFRKAFEHSVFYRL